MELPGYSDMVEIGRGGFGVVYRARQDSVDRQVAVKVLNRVDVDAAGQTRFERECRAMGSLSWHPNIVVVHEAGTTPDGVPYLAMEFFDSGSLADRLAQGTIPPAQVARFGVELTSALSAAHEAGVLHRDLKPGNILVDRLGHAKLGDFGIASLATGPQTASGLITASIAHAPPEVLAGKRATEQSDLYSLGSTLYELLAGSPAFVRESDESLLPVLTRATRDPLPDLRERGVPDPLASVIEIAMAKDPAERFQSATAMHNALESAAASAEVVTATVPAEAAETPTTELPANETIVGQTITAGGITPTTPTTGAPPPVAPITGEYAAIPPPPPPGAPYPQTATTAGKRPTWLFVVGGLVVLAFVVGLVVLLTRDKSDDTTTVNSTGGTETSSGDVLTLGSVVDGEVSTDGSATFPIEGSGTEVAIQVTAVGDFDPVLTLRDESGSEVASNDDTGDGHDAEVVIFLDSGARFEAEVTGFDGAAGSFQIGIVDSSFATTATSTVFSS